MDILDQLDSAAEAVVTVARGIGPEQATLATPCAGWDVQTLVNHLIGSCRRFAARAEDRDVAQLGPVEPASFQQAVDWLVDDARHAARAWRTPGALERTMDSPLGRLDGRFMASITLTELAAHGWDLARATGQKVPLDEGLAAELLAVAKANPRMDQARQSAFGPEQPAPAGASTVDQLAAFLGRAV
jgi:uncharacterized protein (TIGR03086 family)